MYKEECGFEGVSGLIRWGEPGGEGAVMSTTLNDMSSKKKSEPSAEEIAARELVRLAKEQGLSLTGPEGLLKQFTKNVLETALNEEMTEHLGYGRSSGCGRPPGKSSSEFLDYDIEIAKSHMLSTPLPSPTPIAGRPPKPTK